MEILRCSSAGTMESSDAYVEIMPDSSGLNIQVESVVEKQFGEKIRESIKDVLHEYGVEKVTVRVIDRGALECVIRARVETAIIRGKGE